MASGAPPRPARSARPTPPAPARAPRRRAPRRLWLLGTTALLPIAAGQVMAQSLPGALTGPTGGQVVAGQAAIAQTAGRTTITQGTDRAAIDWQQFNVGSQHTVQFVQPSQGSWTLNRVTGPDPSVIAGRVQANGGVAIVNQSGVVFARGAQVDVGALIASAAGITNQNFMAGRMVFDQPARAGARVENHGTITVADRGLAALVGPGVANSGVIRARLGRVALGAAEAFVLDLAGDGLIGLDVTQAVRTAPEGGTALVTNSGLIEAAGGSVLLSAHAASGLVEDLVRHTGRIEAPTLGERSGQVALRAAGGGVRVEGAIAAAGGGGERGGSVAVQGSGQVTLAGASRIDASGGAGGGRVLVGTAGRGRDQRMAARTTVEDGATIRADATARGNGGEIIVNSAERTEMRGTLSARGGEQGGHGGFIEVSGQAAFVLDGIIDLRAPAGAMGEFLLDPQNIVIAAAPPPPALPGGNTITEVVDDLAAVGGSVTQAGRVVASSGADTAWVRISPAVIQNFAAGNITLEANRQIIIDDAVNRTNAGNLTLRAGIAGAATGADITQRAGADISVNGVLTLETQRGAIDLGAEIRATGLTLAASGGITQTGGDIRHRAGAGAALSLSATSASGLISLAQEGNGPLAATFSAPGAVTIRSGRFGGGANAVDGAIAIAGASSGGSITLIAERAGSASAAGTIAIDAAMTSAAGVTLLADGAVTQAPAGAIATGRDPAEGILRIRDRGNAANGPPGVALAAADNRIAVLDAVSGADLAVRSVGFSEGAGGIPPANPTMRVDRATGGSVTLEAPRILVPAGGGTRVEATTGAVGLIASEAANPLDPAPPTTLTISGPVHAGPSQAVRLRADRMTLTGAEFDTGTAGQGVFIVEVGPQTSGRAVRFGGADDPAALWLGQTGALTGADAAALRLGQTTIGGAAGSVTGGDIRIEAGLTFGGILALSATGAVSQAGGAAVGAARLTTRGASDAVGAGSVALADPANLIAEINAWAAGALAITSASPTLTLDGVRGASVALRGATIALGDGAVLSSGRVTLVADGGIAQGAAGGIVAAEFAAEARSGAIALTGSGNVIGTIADALTIAAGNGPLLPDAARGLYASGTVALATQGALTVAGAVESRGGSVALSAGALQTDAPIAVSGGATPTVTLTTNSSGGANGAIGGGGRILTTNLAVAATGAVALEHPGNVVPVLAASTVAGNFRLATSGALTVAGNVSATGTLGLSTPGGALAFNATLNAPRIELRAGTTLTQGGGGALASPAAPLEVLAVAGSGNLTLNAAGAVRVVDGGVAGAAGLSAPGAVSLTSGGAIDLAARVQGATVGLSGVSMVLGAPVTTPAGGAVSLAASGAGAGSTIAQTAAGVITAGLLNVSAQGAVDLSAAPNAVGTLGSFSFADGFGYRSTAAFTVSAPLAPVGGGNADIAIVADAGNIQLLAPILAGAGTVRLSAPTGGIFQAAFGAPVTAARLEVTAGGNALLAPLSANHVAVLGTSSVGGTLAFNTSGNLALAGSIAQSGAGGALLVNAGGTLAVSAGASLAFDTISLGAPGAMTIGGTIGVAQAVPVSIVRLGADGAITQMGAGRIVADTLGLRASGGATLGSATNDVRRIAAAAGGGFALDTSGPLATAAVAAVAVPGLGTADVSGVIGASVTLGAADLTINPGPHVLNAGVHASAADGILTLRADRLALNSAVVAGASGVWGGTVAIAPRTLSRSMVLGADDPAALAVGLGGALVFGAPGYGLRDIVARDVVFGRAEAGAGTLRVGGPSGMLFVTDAVTLQGGSIVLDALFQHGAAGPLTLSAGTGGIVQNAGAVDAPRLVAHAAGSVRLDGTGTLNQAGRISGSAGGDFAYRGAGSYTIAAPGISAPGGTVSLLAPGGSILQTTGAPVTAQTLSVAAQGSAVLDAGGGTLPGDLNRVASLAPSSAATFTLRNAEALSVAGVTANAGFGSAVTLEAPTIALGGDILTSIADGRVVLRTGAEFDAPAAGTITQAGGTIRARDLAASAGGGIALEGENRVLRLGAGQSSSGAFSLNSIVMGGGAEFALATVMPGLEVGARVLAGGGSGVRIATDGLAVAPGLLGSVFIAPGGTVRFRPFTPGTTIGLGGPGGLDGATYSATLLGQVDAQRLVIGGTAGGTITQRQAIGFSGLGTPQTLELLSGGTIVGGGFALSLNAISATAGGSVTLGSAGSSIGRIVAREGGSEGVLAGGSVAVTGLGTLAVDAPVIASGPSVALQAEDFAIAPGATVRSGPAGLVHLRSTSVAGLALGVVDPAPGLTQAEVALLDAQGGTLRLQGNAIALAGTVAVAGAAAGTLELLAGGAVTQAAGTLSADALRVTAAAVQIDRAGNALPDVAANATGNIAIATDGAMTVRGTRSLSGDVQLGAASIALSGAAGTYAVQAAGTAGLTATTGGISGLAGFEAVAANLLLATAPGGAITLSGGNAVGALAAVAGTGVAMANTIAFAAGVTGPGGAALAGDIALTAPAMALNDILAAGTVALTATSGAITQSPGARLAAGTLEASANGGAGLIRLDAGANAVERVGGLASSGDVTLRNAQALTVDVPVTVGDFRTLALEAPALLLDASLAAGTGGRIVLRTGAFEGGARSGGNIVQAGGTITAPTLAALAGGTISIDRAGNAIGTLGGGISASGAALGLGLSAGTSAILRSDAGTLGITGAVAIGPGGTLLLRADDFAIGAPVGVPAGMITLLPATANGSIGYVLGGAAGSTNAGRITLDSTELAFFPSGSPAAELVLGGLGVSGGIAIAGTVPLAVGGLLPRVGRLTLAGDGALVQDAGTALDVAALSARFPNGAVLLDPGGAGNRIAVLEGVIAGGDVAIRGGAGMMELRDGGAGSAVSILAPGHALALRADDLDIQAAVRAPSGTISILPETPGRGVTLGGAGAGTLALGTEEIARLGGGGAALDAPGALRLRIGSDGTARSAGDIVLAGDVRLRDGASVRFATLELVAGQPGAAGGSLRQSGGIVDVGTLTGAAQGDFRLGLPGNTFTEATGISAGTLPAAGATGVVDIAAAGALAASGIASPATVRLAAGAALNAGGIGAASVILQGSSVALGGLIQGSTSVAIQSGGTVTQDPGALIVTGRFSINGSSIALPEDNAFVELTGLAASGPVLALNTVLPLLISGPVSAVGSLSLSTDQAMTVAGGGGITVSGGPGTATLTAGGGLSYAGGLIAGGDATLAAGAALSFTGGASIGGDAAFGAGTAMTLAGTIAVAGNAAFAAGGALGSTGTLAAGGALAATSGGDMALSGLVQSAGAAAFAAGGAFALSGQAVAATDLAITAAGQASLTAGKITAGETVNLTAGAVLLSDFQVDPVSILLQTGGTMLIERSGLVASETIRLAGGSIALRESSVLTRILDVDSSGTMNLDGGLFLIGRAVAFSAPGGIATQRMITVRPREGELPAVVFDTRAGGARPEPLAVVEPDIPGLPANRQRTQVRMPNAEAPGAFGPASAAPGGPVWINIDAGRSPIFLLIDGGAARGTIVSAGRLGIHGTGGSADLFGQFVDANGAVIGGPGAARFGDTTRPAASGTLTRYRINNCVISSINCVVPSQVLSIPQAPPQRVDLNIGGGRITDPDVQVPNVSEEDY